MHIYLFIYLFIYLCIHCSRVKICPDMIGQHVRLVLSSTIPETVFPVMETIIWNSLENYQQCKQSTDSSEGE